jgi:hypothetical protein
LPDTIQGVVTARLDAASARQQLALKVASVFGTSFSLGALRDVHPIAADREELRADLAALEALNLVRTESEGPETRYVFRHAITRDAAYALLPFAQRRELHGAVAAWYERRYADDLAPHYPLLAHHWKSALDPDGGSSAESVARARDALGRAGEQAFASYANREAVQFFGDALGLVEPRRPRRAGHGGNGSSGRRTSGSATRARRSRTSRRRSGCSAGRSRMAAWAWRPGSHARSRCSFSTGWGSPASAVALGGRRWARRSTPRAPTSSSDSPGS